MTLNIKLDDTDKRKKSIFWEKDRNLWSTVCSICVEDKDRYILADSTTKKEAKK